MAGKLTELSEISGRGTPAFKPSLEDLLVDDLTVGGDVLDRAMMYMFTRDMNREALDALQGRVRGRVLKFYEGLRDAGHISETDFGRDVKVFVDKGVRNWFADWTLFAGRMEYQLDELKMKEGRLTPITHKDVEAVAEKALASPDCKPEWKDNNVLGWVRNRCVDESLDYTQVKPSLQYAGGLESFRRDYPELVREKPRQKRGRGV